MEDKEILDLYFTRSENAIKETDLKYRRLCIKVSMAVLNDLRDVDECINDAYKIMWDTIPPNSPNPLKTYLCRIVKNLSLKKYEFNHAKKRNSQYEFSLSELNECISLKKDEIENTSEFSELVKAVNSFLQMLSYENRTMFLRRYWFLQSIKTISQNYNISVKNVSMKLYRIRQQLKDFLIKEGFKL